MIRSRLVLGSLALVLLIGGGILGMRALRGPEEEWALEAIVEGGEGPPTLVLLHGFDSSAEKWAPFAKTIRLPPTGRFIFPQGPDITVQPNGAHSGRAWWPLDLDSYVPKGSALPDLSGASPAGLEEAGDMVVGLLRESGGPGPLVLGGFSQGAMVAAQVAFLSQAPLSGLVLLASTPVNEEAWQAALPRRKGLPVFIAHGRADRFLSFALADRLRQKMERAGLAVTWFPYDGGHDLPPEGVAALNAFLERIWAGK